MMEKHKMLVIGITGNIGVGKSSVSTIIAEKGYDVILTDDIAKHLMANDKKFQKEIIEAFGKDTIKDGKPDKTLIASIVFNDPEKLDILEKITHPRVIDELIKITDEAEAQGKRILFIESALIYEAELEEGFDYIICVDAPEDIAIKRAVERGKMREDHVRKRLERQIPAKEKREASDFVIENKADLQSLRKSVEFILNVIEALAG